MKRALAGMLLLSMVCGCSFSRDYERTVQYPDGSKQTETIRDNGHGSPPSGQRYDNSAWPSGGGGMPIRREPAP